MEPSIDRLVVVSKLLLDERVCALRKENESLKFQLFWKDHDVSALNRAMAYGNDGSSGACLCHACIRCRMYWEDDLWADSRMDNVLKAAILDKVPSTACKFKVWFENLAARIGLVVTYRELIIMESKNVNEFSSDPDQAHIILDRHDFRCMGYGKLILQCRHPDDPDLLRLSELIKILHDSEERCCDHWTSEDE